MKKVRNELLRNEGRDQSEDKDHLLQEHTKIIHYLHNSSTGEHTARTKWYLD